MNLLALYVFGTIAVLGVINMWLIVPAIFLSFIIYGLAKMYLKPSRNLKRLESTVTRPMLFFRPPPDVSVLPPLLSFVHACYR